MSKHPMQSGYDATPWRNYFNQLAPVWDQRCQDPAATVRRLESLRAELGLAPGQDLLEVGCGTGQITGWLQQAVAPGRVVGVDIAPEMVRTAQGKHPGADLRVADACCDSLGESCFDIALCFHSFPHFGDRAAAVSNIARCLRLGGKMIVMHLAGSARINALHSSFGGAVANDHLPPTEEWSALLDPSGLHLLQMLDQEDLFLLTAEKPRTSCSDGACS